MPFAKLSRLAQERPLRILLVNAGEADAITWAGLVQPLRLAVKLTGTLELDIRTPEQVADAAPGHWHVALLVADETQAPLRPELCRAVVERCRAAAFWGGVGAGVLWLADAGVMAGVRIALPWALYADTEEITDRAILTPHLFEIDGRHLSCCGGAASIDFALTLIESLCGASVQAAIKEALCIDDIANLVQLSRRQLERLFKQYLGSLPSRYYLELRLQRARQLLLETNYSIVQVGLMCGFSSGSHFSTAFGALFGNTPREERQRKLMPAAGQ